MIDGLMVSILASSGIDPGFAPLLNQTKDYNIDVCWFSAKHAVLRSKNKDSRLGIKITCPSGADSCLS
jgi:hypothetical protein